MGAIACQITGLSIVCSAVCSGVDHRKHQSSTSLAFVRGIHRWPVKSLHKRQITRNMFPFDDVIMSDGNIDMTSWLHCWTANKNNSKLGDMWKTDLRITFCLQLFVKCSMKQKHWWSTNKHSKFLHAYKYTTLDPNSLITPWHGNGCSITGPLWREFTGPQWIRCQRTSRTELSCFLCHLAWTSCGANSRIFGPLRCHDGVVKSLHNVYPEP